MEQANNDKIDEVLEVVRFIKDNAVMRQEFDERMDRFETRLTGVEANMVTKPYLDEKLADLQGNLTVLIRKEDTKVLALIEILVEKKCLKCYRQKTTYFHGAFCAH